MKIIAVIAWIACGFLSYFQNRREIKKNCGRWTNTDKVLAIIVALFGPIAIFAHYASEVIGGEWE